MVKTDQIKTLPFVAVYFLPFRLPLSKTLRLDGEGMDEVRWEPSINSIAPLSSLISSTAIIV